MNGGVQECTLEHIDNLTHPIHVHAYIYNSST